MKTFGVLFFSIFFLLLTGILENNHSQTPPRSSYSTGIVDSKFFDVKNVSFSRRYGSAGKGEVLQVGFEVHNKTSKRVDLKLFVVGFHEKDNVDPVRRWRIEYPRWRVKDFDKEDLHIVLLDSVPTIERKRVDPNINADDEFTFPRFIEYVQYLDKNPANGIPFKVYGLEDMPPTTLKPADLKKGNNYQIVNAKFKTNVTTLLFSKYKPGHKFFNYIGIIIYDSQNKTAFRHFYRLKYKIKIR